MLLTLASKLGLSFVLRKLRGVPWQVWAAIAVVIAVLAGMWWHSGKVEEALDAAKRAGIEESDAAWQVRFDEMRRQAEQWRQDAEAAQDRITEEEQLRHEAERRASAARADALRLRGPGQAQAGACPRPNSGAGVPESTRPVPRPTPRPADGPGDRVSPDDGTAAVPWGWLVDRAEQCDAYRLEVETWRRWYIEQRRLNEQLRAPQGVN